MPEPVPTIDVSVVILYDGPRMLVNRRPEGSYFGGWWEWPGGKREQNESALDCARRELREEIGFDAVELEEYGREVVDYPGRRVRLTFFVGRGPKDLEPAPHALEHRWLPASEVLGLQFLEPNLPTLQRLIEKPPFSTD